MMLSGSNATSHDTIVVGGGAAGLMAALFASGGEPWHPGRILLLEGSRACGLKILISGGGRCNVLPSVMDDSDYHTQGSRNVLKRWLRTWPLAEVINFFQSQLQLPLVREEETGKLFPASQSAHDVRDALLRAILRGGVEILSGTRVERISRESGHFHVESAGKVFTAPRCILATGGKSLPKSGSDGSGYRLAERLRHTVLTPYPALVPLTTTAAEFTALAGISLPVRWRVVKEGKILKQRTRELLFTHRGFSGPAILDASHWAVRERLPIEVAWLGKDPEGWNELLKRYPHRTIAGALSEALPKRLVDLLVKHCGIPAELKQAHLSAPQRTALLSALSAFPLPVPGDEGFRVAEVTGGGVPLDEVNPSTLESRKTPGLFLCGEILDVLGRMGGFNFLIAWITGRMAGTSCRG